MGDAGFGFIDAAQIIGRAEARRDFLGFLADHARDREDFAVMGERDMGAAITTGEEQAAFFERLGEAGAIVRYCPAFLDRAFQIARIELGALGLLPFGQGEVARIALF